MQCVQAAVLYAAQCIEKLCSSVFQIALKSIWLHAHCIFRGSLGWAKLAWQHLEGDKLNWECLLFLPAWLLQIYALLRATTTCWRYCFTIYLFLILSIIAINKVRKLKTRILLNKKQLKRLVEHSCLCASNSCGWRHYIFGLSLLSYFSFYWTPFVLFILYLF